MATTGTDSKRQARKDSAAKALKKVAESGKKHTGGFINFIRTQGIVGLAVGLAVGVAASDTVKQIVQGFINPVVQFIVGSQSKLEAATWTFHAWGRTATFAWGAALSSTITLIATALVVYWIVHLFRLDRLDVKKDS